MSFFGGKQEELVKQKASVQLLAVNDSILSFARTMTMRGKTPIGIFHDMNNNVLELTVLVPKNRELLIFLHYSHL